MSIATALLVVQGILLAIFCFYAFFKYLYGIASLLPVNLSQTCPTGRRCAVVIVAFNEEYVIEDTISACEHLTYQQKLIVLADDSSDPPIIEKRRALARAKGCVRVAGHGFFEQRFAEDGAGKEEEIEIWESPDFVLFQRPVNTGFKAGSLRRVHDYLERKGIETMYLLDADWHPQPDALEKTFGILEADEGLAFVQTKRIARAEGMNLFQRFVSIMEETCYFVDFQGRQALNHPVLFSGCCALMRLDAIRSVGGFKPGHLTEDLDLTNRLWLAGWRGAYAGHVVNSGEVPFAYDHFRRQQERWAAGTSACMRSYVGPICRSAYLSPVHKASAIRQNAYFFGNIFAGAAFLTAGFTLLWLLVQWNSYEVELYLYAVSSFQMLIHVLLYACLLSVVAGPLLMICAHKRRYGDLAYLPMSIWYAWSIPYTYLIGNMRGVFNISTDWFRTPKLRRSLGARFARTALHTRTLYLATFAIFMAFYMIEGLAFGWIDVFALVWIPSMLIASIE